MTLYPASLLANTDITTDASFLPTDDSISKILLVQNGFGNKLDEEIDDVENDIQKEIEEFFRLDPVPIDDLQINSFLQECDLAKTKYFQDQEIQSSSFSVQPKTLTEIIQSDFEKKSIIPDSGLINPVSKIDHLPPHLQSRLNGIFMTYIKHI